MSLLFFARICQCNLIWVFYMLLFWGYIIVILCFSVCYCHSLFEDIIVVLCLGMLLLFIVWVYHSNSCMYLNHGSLGMPLLFLLVMHLFAWVCQCNILSGYVNVSLCFGMVLLTFVW